MIILYVCRLASRVLNYIQFVVARVNHSEECVDVPVREQPPEPTALKALLSAQEMITVCVRSVHALSLRWPVQRCRLYRPEPCLSPVAVTHVALLAPWCVTVCLCLCVSVRTGEAVRTIHGTAGRLPWEAARTNSLISRERDPHQPQLPPCLRPPCSQAPLPPHARRPRGEAARPRRCNDTAWQLRVPHDAAHVVRVAPCPPSGACGC
jgi:hypothetical protein